MSSEQLPTSKWAEGGEQERADYRAGVKAETMRPPWWTDKPGDALSVLLKAEWEDLTMMERIEILSQRQAAGGYTAESAEGEISSLLEELNGQAAQLWGNAWADQRRIEEEQRERSATAPGGAQAVAAGEGDHTPLEEQSAPPWLMGESQPSRVFNLLLRFPIEGKPILDHLLDAAGESVAAGGEDTGWKERYRALMADLDAKLAGTEQRPTSSPSTLPGGRPVSRNRIIKSKPGERLYKGMSPDQFIERFGETAVVAYGSGLISEADMNDVMGMHPKGGAEQPPKPNPHEGNPNPRGGPGYSAADVAGPEQRREKAVRANVGTDRPPPAKSGNVGMDAGQEAARDMPSETSEQRQARVAAYMKAAMEAEREEIRRRQEQPAQADAQEQPAK